MQDSRENIRKTFFADLFLAIQRSPDRNMTATQVNAIINEQMTMIGPVYERLNHELLDPLIGRVFGIMDSFGLFGGPDMPELPEELSGQTLKVEYISILAQAQQAAGLGGIDRLTEFVGTVAGFQPEALDVMDVDTVIDEYAKMLGTPAAIIRSDEDIADIRQKRAEQQAAMEQAQQAQQMASAANQGAGAVKQAADAASGGGLDTLAGMLGMGAEA